MFFNFSVRNVDFHASTTGVRIRVITDCACHLYLRLSSVEPLIHKKASLRRGVAFAEDVRFCFTVFEDNEQDEWGDTHVHTWWKEAWPPCTTKWLYFWGSRMGTVCVSTTAPFSYHNDGVAPETPWVLLFHESWPPVLAPPYEFELKFLETWPPVGAPLLFHEPWTS